MSRNGPQLKSPIRFLESIGLLLLMLTLSRAQPLPAADLVGAEARISLPTSAEWNGIVNFRPGNRETVSVNPPQFSWLYSPNPLQANSDITPRKFAFLISTNPACTDGFVVAVTNQYFYNLLSPLPAGKTYYWRIGYFSPASTLNTTWTTTDSSWSTTVSTWSTVRQFTIASNAVSWDRSQLASETYLDAKAAHPHLLFRSGDKTGLANYLPTTAGSDWRLITNTAAQTITNSWWPAGIPSEYLGNWGYYLGDVMLVWKTSSRPEYANCVVALTNMASWFIANNGPITDFILDQKFRPIYRAIAFGYDWLYDDMDANQRSNVLRALEMRSAYILYGGSAWFDSVTYGWGVGNTNGIYAGGRYARRFSQAKKGDSHAIDNYHFSLPGALAAYGEGTNCRALFDMALNYQLGVTYPYGYEGEANQGRAYSTIHLFDPAGGLGEVVMEQVMFPEVDFSKHPYWRRSAEFWGGMLPVGFSQGHEPWGDTSWGRMDRWRYSTLKDLALLVKDGVAYRHYLNEEALTSRYQRTWDTITIPYFFSTPTPQDSTNLIKFFPQGGFYIENTLPENTPQAFTNGVGWVFQARPRGSEGGHSHYSDGSFQIWAYGAAVTDAGAQMSAYAKSPMSHYCLFVNGIGTAEPETGPIQPFYSRFTAFTNNTDFSYIAADLTGAYPRNNFLASGWLMPSEMTSLYSGGPLKSVTKVQRHILFMHKKYFVIYDDLAASQPAKFSWLYHVMENTLANFDATNASFTYTCTNQFNRAQSVAVNVAHITDPSLLEITDLTGTNVYSNPITGENYYTRSDAYKRAHAIWVSNRQPAMQFHFLSVVYPVKPGTSAPRITRLDDFTVEVTTDTEHDVISFDPRTTQAATLIVNPTTAQGLTAGPASPQDLRVLHP